VSGTTELNLSKLTRLQDVVFLCQKPIVGWITTALNTIRSKRLQQLSLEFGRYVAIRDSERDPQEWLDLDYLLVRFLDSNPLRLRVTYKSEGMSDHMAVLLPELTKRGIVELVQSED